MKIERYKDGGKANFRWLLSGPLRVADRELLNAMLDMVEADVNAASPDVYLTTGFRSERNYADAGEIVISFALGGSMDDDFLLYKTSIRSLVDHCIEDHLLGGQGTETDEDGGEVVKRLLKEIREIEKFLASIKVVKNGEAV